MPKGIIESLKRSGVKEPYALLRAAGWKEGDTEAVTKKKLSRFQKRRKRKAHKSASAHEQANALGR